MGSLSCAPARLSPREVKSLPEEEFSRDRLQSFRARQDTKRMTHKREKPC